MKSTPSFIGGALIAAAIFAPFSHAQTPPVINSFSTEGAGVFLGGRGTFSYDVEGAASLEIDQGVGVVTGSSARFLQTGNEYILPRGSTWSYLSDGSDQGASDVVAGNVGYSSGNWKHPNFNDAAWLSGPGQLGYGDTVATDVMFVDVDPVADGDQKNATTYYRTQFSISAGEIASLDNLFLEMRRDDGAVVYLNGEEIARMNVGDGVLSFDTYTEDIGHSVAGGGAETTYFQCELSPSILAAGANTLAVEVHQANDTSSDTRFDLGLFQKVTAASAGIFPEGSVWSGLADGSNLGDAAIVSGAAGYDTSNWKHPGFDDSTWPIAPAEFGYDVSVLAEATILRFGPNEDNADNDVNNKYLAYYFRNEFQVGAAELGTLLSAAVTLRVDDGAVVYVNGVEIARDGIDPGEVTSASTADISVGGVAEAAYDEFGIPPSVLVAGTNTIAVEVHQASGGSSDVGFDADVTLTNVGPQSVIKVPRGAVWRYLDDGGASLGDSSSLIVSGVGGYDASNWKHPNFDDSAWRSGEGELGYGDTALTVGGHVRQTFTTELPFGPDPANKFTTTYFRRDFTVNAADIANALGARLIATVDDGAIVYLNGVEIWRTNMPGNPDPDDPEAGPAVDGTTFASVSVGNDGRTASFVNFGKNLLVAGQNTIAVELHQSSLTTSDAVFDLGMEFLSPAGGAVTYTLTATNEFGSVTATTSASTISVPATPIYLVDSNASNVSWIFPEVWSDKLVPHAGNYILYGQFDSVLRTPVGETDPIFGGSRLDLAGGSTQLFLAHAGGTASLPLVNLDGGRIVNGVTADLAVGGAGNSIVVLSDSTIGTNNGAGTLTVSADLSGSGQVRIIPSSGDATIFSGDNAAFSGPWRVDGILAPSSPTALGSGPINVNATGTFDPAIDLLDLLPNALVVDADGTLNLDQTVAFVSGAVSIDGNIVPDGSYSATDLDDLGFGGVFTGASMLFVGSVSPDSDGDGLLDSWELMFFPNLAATDGSGDLDGDGQSDGSEFFSRTSPADPLDVFQITSISQAANGDVTITWPTKAGVSYGVRYGDLSTWTLASDGINGDGSEMSFTDDGSFTGGAPVGVEERRYQVFIDQ